MAGLKCVFLDMDGIINKAIMINDKPAAPTSVDKLELYPDVAPALERLKAAGYLMISVTNKPDIERGLMTQEDVDAIFQRIREELPQISEIFACFHEGSDCYKPKPGMILEAAKKYDIDLTESYMIGDRCGDIACGQAAGVKTVWVNRQYPLEPTPNPAADYTTDSTGHAIDWILGV